MREICGQGNIKENQIDRREGRMNIKSNTFKYSGVEQQLRFFRRFLENESSKI